MKLDVFECHKNHGALNITSDLMVSNQRELGLAYTPGIAKLCTAIVNDPSLVDQYTMKGKLVAVITDGSAVLGLGNIGPEAGLPVVEGKALLANKLAGITAVPLCIQAISVDDQVKTIQNIAGSFSAIHLEDIKSPECFELEEKLKKKLNIPVHHDDQDGTAIAVLAGLMNAMKVKGCNLKSQKIVICGSGASGIATARLLLAYGVKNIIMVDRKGILDTNDAECNIEQKKIAKCTNPNQIHGDMRTALKNADVFIGLSVGNVLTEKDIQLMNVNPIIFALANPIPEINPDIAKKAGGFIIATGSKQYPNQINNVLVFPGLFKGLLESRKKFISIQMKLNIANSLAKLVLRPTKDNIIPDVFDKRVVSTVTEIVKKT